MTMTRVWAWLVSGASALALAWWTGSAAAQSAPVQAEYLMTYEAELDLPQVFHDKLFIYNVKPGGWAKGPTISATFIPPGADWLRVMPSGAFRLDVRATLRTDEGDLIYITYNGIIQHSQQSFDKLMKGEVVTPADGIYFMTAPTFETSSKKYDWLNRVQAVGKFVEARVTPERAYVRYDIFVVR
jgi:hypothetical protein